MMDVGDESDSPSKGDSNGGEYLGDMIVDATEGDSGGRHNNKGDNNNGSE